MPDDLQEEDTPKWVVDVLAYFLRNPQAADDLEGVARWRLRQQAIHRGVAEVQDALRWLVEQGFLLAESSPGTDPIYRLDPRRVEQARQLIGKRSK